MKLHLRIGDYVDGEYAPIDADTLSAKLRAMVEAMVIANPTKSEEEHLHYLLHNAQGRRLAEHLNNLSKGETRMPDITKLIEIIEHGLNAQVPKPELRDGETFAKSFSRKYENDIDFRRQWQSVTEAKHSIALSALSKGAAGTTSTVVADDDSTDAVQKLQQIAKSQGRTFEQVFSAPENRALAAQTYTTAHR